MQTIDLVILIALLLGGVWGLSGGMTRILSPLALLLALTAAISAHPQVAVIFSEVGGTGIEVQAFAFLLTFLMGLIVFGLINRAFSAAIKAGGLGEANRLFGLLMGLALAAFLAGGTVSLAGVVGNHSVRTAITDSQLAPLALQFFHTLCLWAERLLPPLDPPA